MNYIDMFVLVLLIWAVFKGITRGFIMQLTTLAALVVGIYAALKLSGFTSDKLTGHLSLSPESLYMVAMAITFILVFIGINVIGRITEKMAEAVQLSIVNRMLGVLFSVAKTIFIVGILLAFVDRMDRRMQILPPKTREHSICYKPFVSMAVKIFPALDSRSSDYGGIREQV